MSTIGYVSDDETRFYSLIPKVHLHSHILGMVLPDTFIDLAQKYKVDIGKKDPCEVYRYYDFRRLVEILSAIASVIREEEDFSRVLYEAIEYSYKTEHVLYSELFVQTTYHLLYGAGYRRIVDGFSDGIRRAERDFGVKTRLILGLNRQLPAPIAAHIVREAIAYPSEFVIGIGLEDFEGFGPPQDFAEAYALAEAAGLRRTAHAGEHGPAQNIIDALITLGCERIDHGYRMVTDNAIMYRLAESDVHFATCPTVASRQGWAKPDGHVLKQMHDTGIWLSVNSDDPAIIGTNLNREYALAAKFMDVGRAEMIEIARRTIDAAWMTGEDKARLRKRFDDEIAKIPERQIKE